MARLPTPSEGILLTHFIVSDDVERSRRFYTEVLGGPGADPLNSFRRTSLSGTCFPSAVR